MPMRDTPTPAEIIAITKQVQSLGPDAQASILFGLLGRMMVKDMDAVMAELEAAERIEIDL